MHKNLITSPRKAQLHDICGCASITIEPGDWDALPREHRRAIRQRLFVQFNICAEAEGGYYLPDAFYEPALQWALAQASVVVITWYGDAGAPSRLFVIRSNSTPPLTEDLGSMTGDSQALVRSA